MGKKKSKIRTLKSGAVRDTDDGKFEFFGFMHPLNDYSFAKYMHEHRKMADGSMRDSNNWWAGFGLGVCLQSLVRHVEDLKLIHTGFFVYEKRVGTKAERIVHKTRLKTLPKNYKEITIEECCCAIRFNSSAYQLEHFKEIGVA